MRVDSAFVAEANSGAFSHIGARTQSGKMLVFNLPGGKTLHVMPRAIAGNMIAMEVVLFDGNQTAMTADMKLESGDTFALSGEKYSEGTLLIRISPTTAAIDHENLALTSVVAAITYRLRPTRPSRSRTRRRR